MITMNNIYRGAVKAVMPLFASSLVLLALPSCSDFYNPVTEDKLDASSYISDNTELYTGFIGIMTKLQAVGDKEILLTDTRAEMLEPTKNAGTELYAIYNYDEDLKGNSYASPAPYYEVIIACNDYLNKVKEYRKQPQVDDAICKNLISSTIRIKAWTYKTIGEIYGEAVWFDEPIGKVQDFLASAEAKPMNEIVDKCLELMDNGFDGVPSNLVVNWIEWLDPDNVTNIANSSYRKWNYMVPPYAAVYSELCLWKGAYLDAAGDKEAAQQYYLTAADDILADLNTYVSNESNSGNNPYWIPNAGTAGRYQNLWLANDPYAPENVSAILYDYTNSQTNTLVKHFCTDYPAEYLLKPTEVGKANFTDPTLNPGGNTSEGRFKALVGQSSDGDYIAKFRTNGGRNGVRTNAYQDDVHIYIYRATQYHMMLAEALNNLARFTACDCILNKAISGQNQRDLVLYDSLEVRGVAPSVPVTEAVKREWRGFTRDWTADASWGTRKYPGIGIRGAFSLSERKIKTEEDATLAKAKRDNDIQILREAELEFSCEGKTYAWMNRMAVRYDDLNIVANEVCPKYKASGKEEEIRAKILAGGNWVKYPLK